MDFATLFSKQLHLLFDDRKDQNLLVLIQNAITALIKDIHKLLRCAESKHIEDMLAALLEYQTNVCLVQEALLSEVSFLNCVPDLLAFSRATD